MSRAYPSWDIRTAQAHSERRRKLRKWRAALRAWWPLRWPGRTGTREVRRSLGTVCVCTRTRHP